MLLAYLTRTAFAIVLALPLSVATINVYLSPPGVQDTSVTGTEKESFDSLSVGVRGADFVSGVGTYRLSSTSALAVQGADGWGGANGTNYSSLGKQSATTGNVQLDLFGPRAYFGFWWSAIDPMNVIQLYSAGSFLGQITRNDIVGFLPGNNTVTSLGGSSHSTSSYYGNPNNGSNPLEAYAYIHFVTTGGVTFDRIVFSNGSLQTGFETDNVAARVAAPIPPDDWVPFREIPVTIGNQSIPEPASFGFAATGLALIILRLGKRTAA